MNHDFDRQYEVCVLCGQPRIDATPDCLGGTRRYRETLLVSVPQVSLIRQLIPRVRTATKEAAHVVEAEPSDRETEWERQQCFALRRREHIDRGECWECGKPFEKCQCPNSKRDAAPKQHKATFGSLKASEAPKE